MSHAVITESQLKLLQEIDTAEHQARGVLETFCPNPSVVNALTKRGLIQARLVGMRWWRMKLTPAGRSVIQSADQDSHVSRTRWNTSPM